MKKSKNGLLIWTSRIFKRLQTNSSRNGTFSRFHLKYFIIFVLYDVINYNYVIHDFSLHRFKESFFFFFVFSSFAPSSSEEDDDELDLSSRISSVVTTTTEGVSGTAGASLT